MSGSNGGLNVSNGGLSGNNGGLSGINGGFRFINGGLSVHSVTQGVINGELNMNGEFNDINGGLSVINGELRIVNGELRDNGGLSVHRVYIMQVGVYSVYLLTKIKSSSVIKLILVLDMTYKRILFALNNAWP